MPAVNRKGFTPPEGGPFSVKSPTKHDANDEPNGPFYCIFVNTTGDVKITTMNGDDVVLPNLVAGMWHAQPGKRIWSTGTVPTTVLVGY